MPDLTFARPDIRLWTEGQGNLAVSLPDIDPSAPLPSDVTGLFAVNFSVTGNQPIAIGGPGNMKLAIHGNTSANLMPIRAGQNGERSQLLEQHGLQGFFLDSRNAGAQLLVLRLGASTGGNATAAFPYSVLSAKGTLELGADAGYVHIKPYPLTAPAGQMIAGMIGDIRLPAEIQSPPAPGEVIAYSFGGYLHIGIGFTAGYEMQGTRDSGLGRIELSEHYDLSVLGKLDLKAGVAGSYSVQVRGTGREGWVQVVVQRTRSSDFAVAADVGVDVAGELNGLPDHGRDFLGAALGVNVKNWFNLLDKARELANPAEMRQKLGSLAKDFIDEWAAGETQVLDRIRKVVEAYGKLDNSSITLFDRYFDRLPALAGVLDRLMNLTKFEDLTGEADADLWAVLGQLTGGDPLGFFAGRTLDELKARAQQTLDLIRDQAHQEIRSVVEAAKRGFRLDGFLADLAKVDNVAALRALEGTRAGNFAERLIGRGIAELRSGAEAKKALQAIRNFLKKERDFETRFDGILKTAAKQTVSAKLAAGYSAASESRALIDIEINLAHPHGRELLRAAAHGDFQETLSGIRPEMVRIHDGVFTHAVTRESTFLINIIGWHLNWNYSGFDKVVVEAEQRIVPNAQGLINVFTTLELKKERERKRHQERVYTNFIFRLAGESAGVVPSGRKRLQFLINAITAMSASYQLAFSREKTGPRELDAYLSFARTFGLDKAGATPEQVRRLLPMKNGDFGTVSAVYDVGFSEQGLQHLFRGDLPEEAIRLLMRRMVLANYLKKGVRLGEIAWCYASGKVHEHKRKDNRLDVLQQLTVNHPASPIPGIEPPASVFLSTNAQVLQLDRLILTEDKFVEAFLALNRLLRAKQPKQPEEYEKELQALGEALKAYDDVDEGENTVFAVMDGLIGAAGGDTIRHCSLSLRSRVDGREAAKTFFLQPPV